MAKLNPKNWQGAFKWQYEAYPIFTSVYVNASQTKEKNKYYTDWADFLNKFEDGHLMALKPNKQILKIGNIAIKESLAGNGGYYKEIKKVHKEIDIAIKACLKARARENASLSSWWPQAQKALSHAANILFSFDYTFDGFLKDFQEKNPKDFEILNSYIRNKRLSFMDEASKKLIELDAKYDKNLDKVFDDFIKDFGWFQNTYKGTFRIDKKWLQYYLKEIKSKKNQHQPIKEKKEVLPKKYKIISELTNDVIIFRDDKKKLLLLAVDLIDSWIRQESEKNDWQFEVMRWLTVDEIIEIIKTGKNKNLKKAEKYNNENKRLGLMTHVGYADIDENFWNNVMTFYTFEDNVKEVRGIVASKGVYRGAVKIIFDAKKDAVKFNNGDILVTSMTRPEFLPLMSKAGAFITDEGGISCHAAIVAREMKKPCIIATKNATRILKDGDIVEVNANEGVIKIVK